MIVRKFNLLILYHELLLGSRMVVFPFFSSDEGTRKGMGIEHSLHETDLLGVMNGLLTLGFSWSE
jgi:hypothetical protein